MKGGGNADFIGALTYPLRHMAEGVDVEGGGGERDSRPPEMFR